MTRFTDKLKTEILSEFKSTVNGLGNLLNEHNSKLTLLENRITTLETTPTVNTDPAVGNEELISEIEDRRSCAHNFIVYDSVVSDETSDDLNRINDVFINVSDFPLAISTGRFDVFRNRHAVPLKVYLQRRCFFCAS